MVFCIKKASEFDLAFQQLITLLPKWSDKIEITSVSQDLVLVISKTESGQSINIEEISFESEKVLLCLEKLFFSTKELLERDYLISLLALSLGYWTSSQKAKLHEIGLIVNSIASFANATQKPQRLKQLYKYSTAIIASADAAIKADSDKLDAVRPWRLLNFNHCIVATRSCDTKLIKMAYAQLLEYLPEEGDFFFQLALQRVQQDHYPSDIRLLVENYHYVYNNRAHIDMSPVEQQFLH